MRRVVLIAVAAALLAGCASEDAPDRRAEEPRTATEAQTPPCELHLRGGGVFVRIAGDQSRETCRRWAASRPPEGRWSETAGSASNESFERVCVVYRGGTSAGFYAAPTIATNGRAKGICGGLISQGWGELNRPSSVPGPEPQPSDLAPVRCSEGRCVQGGKPVARPAEGALCDGGAWTYAGLTSDQEAGLWRCLPDPAPREPVVCDRLIDTCRQDDERVYPPRAEARCGPEGRVWQRSAAPDDTQDVYRCVAPGGGERS